jgi:spermidine/putrescine transport system ATP-binding protein
VHVDVGEPADLVVDVPNHSGPQSSGFHPGMAVSCVCAADAIRVLQRSPAAPAAESG